MVCKNRKNGNNPARRHEAWNPDAFSTAVRPVSAAGRNKAFRILLQHFSEPVSIPDKRWALPGNHIHPAESRLSHN